MIFVTLVDNDDISRCFFHFFEIFIFWAVREVKGQKITHNENQKLHPSPAISQEQYRYSLWSWVLVHLCKIMISPGFFFHFWYFIFPAVRGQKMAQDDKKFCLLHFVSQELYIIWSWFLVHMCKRIIHICRAFLHFFQILIFRVNSGAKEQKLPEMTIISVTLHIWVTGQKMAQNNKKFCHTPYLRNCTSYDCVFRAHV